MKYLKKLRVQQLRDWKKLMEIVRGRVDALAFGHEGKMQGVKQQIIEKLKIAKRDIERLLKLRKESDLIREMKLRSGRGQHIRYYLDANKSVREQACYRIRIEGNKVSAGLDPQIMMHLGGYSKSG